MLTIQKKEEEIIRYLHTCVSSNAKMRWVTIFLARGVIWVMLITLLLLVYNISPRVSDSGAIWVWMLIWPTSIIWFISTTIKHIIRAKRPFLVLENFTPLFRFGTLAFPSGHTVFMVSLSVWVYFVFGMVIGGLFLVFSLISAIARVASGVHWPRDIIGGILLVILFYSSIFIFF